MNLLDIISLADAKIYLRIDDTLNDDDNQITTMIETALEFVADWTNYVLLETTKEYLFEDGCARVYDFPINSVVSTIDDLVTKKKPLYTRYETSDNDIEEIELNVGYSQATDVPQWIKTVAYEIIGIYYYQKDTQDITTALSPLSMELLEKNKRFIL